MQLDGTDLRFIELIAGADRDFVASKLANHPVRLEAMSGVPPLPPAGSRLVEFAKLAVRVAMGALRSSPATGMDSVAFDRVPDVLADRLEYLAFFSPAERVWGVGRDAPLCSRGTAAHAARLLFGILPLVVRASRESKLAPHYLPVARMCLRVVAAASATSARTVHVFRAYRLETALLAGHLRGAGIRVDVVAETTPLAAYNRELLADVVTLASPYQVDEARVFAGQSRVGEYRLWGPTQAPMMDRVYRGAAIADLPDIVGVYTQGYWLRERLGSVDAGTAAEMMPLEEEFARIVGDLARANPAVRFVVFPHPQERSHHERTGDRGPARFEGIANVEFAGDGAADSATAFGGVGLGITTLSTVGFDRLYMGFRTLFYFGGVTQMDRGVVSGFNALFFDDATAFADAVECARRQTHAEFMRAHFSRDAYPGWLPDGPGLPRRAG